MIQPDPARFPELRLIIGVLLLSFLIAGGSIWDYARMPMP